MAEDVEMKQMMPVRARPEVLYRLVMDPKRRLKWDKNLVKAEYEGGEGKLSSGAVVNYKLSRSYLGLGFQVKYGQLIPSQRGSWDSVRHVGPLEKLSQHWQFKAMPGGTEVTLTVKGRVKYGWVKPQIERMLMQLVMSTLLELQRAVDAPAAQMVEDLGREMQEKQKAEEKAAKEAAKAAKKKR